MARQDFDKSSKWLIGHYGKSILYLGGAREVRSCKALQAELVQPRSSCPMVCLRYVSEGEEPPEQILEECRERIEKNTTYEEATTLLAVSQIFTRLKFSTPELLAILGGSKVMIESPLIQELVAEKLQTIILRVLKARFTNVPLEMETQLRTIQQEDKLNELAETAAKCENLDPFREALFS